MTTLAQIIAIKGGVKTQAAEVETDLYHTLAKKQFFTGLDKRYQPKDEENGDRLPPEQLLVQAKAEDVITKLIPAMTRMIDVVATTDEANTHAKADLVLADGTVLARQLPVTTLMSLDKECERLAAFIGRIPVLDPGVPWEMGDGGVFRSPPVETNRTQKVLRSVVLYPHTPEHPAQVEKFTEDVPVGVWTRIDFSGAVPADRVADILWRLDTLRTAIKFAREEANKIEVTDVNIGAGLFSYLFEGGTPASG